MQNIWSFQFLNPLEAEQATALEAGLKALLPNWEAHGQKVQSRVTFRYGHFLFIEALTEVSGCGIDWLHAALTDLIKKLRITPADNSRIFFWQDAEQIDSIHFGELEAAISTDKLHAYTRVFDSSALLQGEFARWEVPLKDSWMARYLPQMA